MKQETKPSLGIVTEPQCQYFVVRKKRLCRMTVRPGKQYCGEHQPEPTMSHEKPDSRIPCPNDPKHTCYASKLEKHLAICNARKREQPDYIVENINTSSEAGACTRTPLSEVPRETLLNIVEKVNLIYEKYIKDSILNIPEQPIHTSILPEFKESDRAESSLRHLRQASSLMRIAEDEGLVKDGTCYVELGAGKGQLSYYLCRAWCDGHDSGRVLLVDRASLRHKRDNKLHSAAVCRIRADITHLALERVPDVAQSEAVVGFAKHLCGVATDLALRCVTSDAALHKTSGLVLATCCHHRCQTDGYVANRYLQELGITSEELNVIWGIVSWATSGDGISRERRNKLNTDNPTSQSGSKDQKDTIPQQNNNENSNSNENIAVENIDEKQAIDKDHKHASLNQEYREIVGRKAKAIIDWGRILYLRAKGFDAKLCYYVPTSVSLENVCIVAKKLR